MQEIYFIIYTRGGGSWCFRPSSRGALANFTPIAGIGHLISEPKFKIPIPPLLISDKSLSVWEFTRTRCLQFGTSMLHHRMLLHAVICVAIYKAYVKGQGHSTASLSATCTFRFIFLIWFLLMSALCFTPFLIFSSLCLFSFLFCYQVVCLACFRYFLDSLIFTHTSVQPVCSVAVVIYFITVSPL